MQIVIDKTKCNDLYRKKCKIINKYYVVSNTFCAPNVHNVFFIFFSSNFQKERKRKQVIGSFICKKNDQFYIGQANSVIW